MTKPKLAQSLINLQDFFGPHGRLQKELPRYTPRPEQVQLATAVAAALEQKQHALLEGGTGVGKSLAYLVPGIAWAVQNRQRLLISTYTKALQTQLMELELPRLAQAENFGRPIQYAICLGQNNYICLHRMIKAGQGDDLQGLLPFEVDALHGLMRWCRGEVTGLRQDAPMAVNDVLWRRVQVQRELCLGQACAYYEPCYIERSRLEQEGADILVANHSLFLSNCAMGRKLLPDFHAAILDEAHKLEDAAVSFLGDSVAQGELEYRLAAFQPPHGEVHAALARIDAQQANALSRLALVTLENLETWWKVIQPGPMVGTEAWRLTPERLAGIADLEPITSGLRELGETAAGVGETASLEDDQRLCSMAGTELKSFADQLEHWIDLDDKPTPAVHWAEPYRAQSTQKLRLQVTPIDFAAAFQELVFKPYDSVILTSATLAVDQTFTYLKKRLGIEQAIELVVHSPFDYAEQAALYLPKGLPDPRQGEPYEAAVLDQVEKLIRVFQGGVFVLCTSHRFMRWLAERLRERLPDEDLLMQGEASPTILLEQFRQSQRAVMLGVETFWQGVDVPGDALRCVIITRLPFDVPTHPVHQARVEHLEAQGDDPFQLYSIPRAVIMLRQGFGRLIRHHSDRGVVAILDSRVQTRHWGRIFLNSLPPCKRLQHLEQVAAFAGEHFEHILSK